MLNKYGVIARHFEIIQGVIILLFGFIKKYNDAIATGNSFY